MQISIIKEQYKNEQRVSSTPEVIKLLQRMGLEVLILKKVQENYQDMMMTHIVNFWSKNCRSLYMSKI